MPTEMPVRLNMPTVQQKDVVPKIAKIVKPVTDTKIARNSIRNIIKRAISNGQLIEVSTLEFEHDDFWRWAVGKWPKLLNHPAIPAVSIVNNATVQVNLPSLSSSATMLNMPPSSRMKEAHKSLQQKHIETLEEIDRLKARNAELEPLKVKSDAIKKKLSLAGKKGGRGKEI